MNKCASETNATELFLKLADPAEREICMNSIGMSLERSDWAALQREFLLRIDEYIGKELKKPVEANIGAHEAGGQWRIAFPHQAVRGGKDIHKAMKQHMEARVKWVDKNLYHGFPDCCEVHHEVETFLYFQMPLVFWKLSGMETALKSIEHLAHHTGNWEYGVPAWYDWEKHLFTSTWLGTKSVRNFPPYDYQEANHFRFTDVALAYYTFSGEKRYLDLAIDYADMWCRHIEKCAASGEPIKCSIVPEEAEVVEMGRAGAWSESGNKYKVFYSIVADNTVYDIAGAMMDLYRVTHNDRYIKNAQLLMDQLFSKGSGGRPATSFTGGEWKVNGPGEENDLTKLKTFVSECSLLARLAIRHDMIMGLERYREQILNWADTIDEEENLCDQMMANILVAAHFYDGNPQWLSRAYAMALRTIAATEKNDEFHQCNWVSSRQGSKFVMEMLYQPLLGGVEWGTRGNLPVRCFRHCTADGERLPEGVSFRTWRIDAATLGFEAVNSSADTVEWCVKGVDGQEVKIFDNSGKEIHEGKISAVGKGKVRGKILLSSGGFLI